MSNYYDIVTLGKDIVSIELCNGQVAAMRYKNIDLIHQGSLPLDLRDKDCISRISRGAPNYSGLEAFPFVGKPDRVFTKKGEVMNYDTHGLPRSIPFIFNGAVKDAVYFYQTHDGKTKISNIKFKESGKGPESLDAIFPYTLNKDFYLDNGSLHIESSIKNEGFGQESFHYDFLTHPMFIAPHDYEKGVFFSGGNKSFTLADVLREKGNVKLLDGVEMLQFVNKENGITIGFGHDFGNTMIWTPGIMQGVFGVEPKSFSGVRNVQKDTDGRYLGAQMKDYYSLNITPFEE
ncbi:hypothetical protein J4226_04980 [Candidatus Pacearchaeota archaeon]|nr:hypothetical protein [Candidatus Pacearchaeota archaeon]